MDNVLVDFRSGIKKLSDEKKIKYESNIDDVPGIGTVEKSQRMEG